MKHIARIKQLHARYLNRENAKALAADGGVSYQALLNNFRAKGLAIHKRGSPLGTIHADSSHTRKVPFAALPAILARLRAGETYHSLAADYGVTSERIRQFAESDGQQKRLLRFMPDAAEVRRQLCDERQTAMQIAEHYEVHISTVRRFLKNTGVKLRRGKYYPEEKIVEAYKIKSTPAIGEEFGCGGGVIVRILREHNVEVRRGPHPLNRHFTKARIAELESQLSVVTAERG